MHEYDTVLKALLQSPQNTIFERITGAKIDRWLNVEFPEVQQTRVDMLGLAATERKRLLGLELQSANDMKLPLRMAEYALRTYRLYEAFPDQYVRTSATKKCECLQNSSARISSVAIPSSTSARWMKSRS
jgi:predicted transposase YdaD